MDEIAARSGRYLVLPERRADIAMPPAELMEHFAFDLYALMIVLRFTSLLLLNSTNKDIYSSVEVSAPAMPISISRHLIELVSCRDAATDALSEGIR